jgi:hypothetical protein
MPEVILCKDCKQSINKEVDQYVILERGTDRYPEVLAHAACEQKRATAGLGIDRRIRSRYSARHLSLAAAAAGAGRGRGLRGRPIGAASAQGPSARGRMAISRRCSKTNVGTDSRGTANR